MLQADKEEREGATFAPPPLGRVSERLARGSRPASAVAMGLTATSWEGLDPRFETEKTRASERRRQRLREHEEVREPQSSTGDSVQRVVGGLSAYFILLSGALLHRVWRPGERPAVSEFEICCHNSVAHGHP